MAKLKLFVKKYWGFFLLEAALEARMVFLSYVFGILLSLWWENQPKKIFQESNKTKSIEPSDTFTDLEWLKQINKYHLNSIRFSLKFLRAPKDLQLKRGKGC